jgi:hypothetical protein
MDSTDEYQRRAEDCRLLARLMPTELDRRAMLAAARRWRALAGEATALGLRGGTDRALAASRQERRLAGSCP